MLNNSVKTFSGPEGDDFSKLFNTINTFPTQVKSHVRLSSVAVLIVHMKHATPSYGFFLHNLNSEEDTDTISKSIIINFRY